MRGFVGRRRQQQFASFFGMTCLALCACTNGKGMPLVFADGGEAGASGTGASTAGHSGMRAIDASVEDDEPVLNSQCRRLESMWPSSAASEEKKMFDALNALRANPTSLCASPIAAPEPLYADAALQCAARMRARDGGSPKGGGPDYIAGYYPDQRSQEQSGARELAKYAGSTRIDAEIVFYNVSSAAAVIDVLEAKPDEAAQFCFAATNAWFPNVGVGRYGSVWVMVFSSGLPVSTRPPTSGTGPSGPPGTGNSGTAGR